MSKLFSCCHMCMCSYAHERVCVLMALVSVEILSISLEARSLVSMQLSNQAGLDGQKALGILLFCFPSDGIVSMYPQAWHFYMGSVLVRVTIAVMKHQDQRKLGKKEFL